VGAPYVLLEGFYGNTLFDVTSNMCDLPIETQQHIITQWTGIQAKLATLKFPQIGSICSVSASGEPVIGKVSELVRAGCRETGPFSTAADYFNAMATVRLDAPPSPDNLRVGALVFRDIIQKTDLFNDLPGQEGDSYHFNHMDLCPENILVDDHFNIIGVIDWEFAQSAPWQVNHYPYPFPLLDAIGDEILLHNPTHHAYEAELQREVARDLYRDGFDAADGHGTFSKVLESRASRIFACYQHLGGLPHDDSHYIHEMVRLAFGMEDMGLRERYIRQLELAYPAAEVP
jgi:hypothetical protein